jgi:hypothetical protein
MVKCHVCDVVMYMMGKWKERPGKLKWNYTGLLIMHPDHRHSTLNAWIMSCAVTIS